MYHKLYLVLQTVLVHYYYTEVREVFLWFFEYSAYCRNVLFFFFFFVAESGSLYPSSEREEPTEL